MKGLKNWVLIIAGLLIAFKGPSWFYQFGAWIGMGGLLILFAGLRISTGSTRKIAGCIGVVAGGYFAFFAARGLLYSITYAPHALLSIGGLTVVVRLAISLAIIASAVAMITKKEQTTSAAAPEVDKGQQLITYACTLYGIDATAHKLYCAFDFGVKGLGPVCVCDDGHIYFYRQTDWVGVEGEKAKLALSSIKEVVVLIDGAITFNSGNSNEFSRRHTSFYFNTHDGEQFQCAIIEGGSSNGYPDTIALANLLKQLGLTVNLPSELQ